MKYKMVIVVREDLQLSCGKLAVQVAHAAVECTLKSKKKNPWFDDWLKEGQKKVVVKRSPVYIFRKSNYRLSQMK